MSSTLKIKPPQTHLIYKILLSFVNKYTNFFIFFTIKYFVPYENLIISELTFVI